MAFNVVGLALKRPYTFVVMALMLLILGLWLHCAHPPIFFQTFAFQ